MNRAEEHFYAIAALEIAEKRVAPGVFAKAFSEAEGDERKSYALYIKLRAQQLESDYLRAERDRKREESEAWERAKRNREGPVAHSSATGYDRPCCWTCTSFSTTAWIDRTKGYCRLHESKTLAYEACADHSPRVRPS